MPLTSHPSPRGPKSSFVWSTGGRHLWPSGGSSSPQSHDRGHLVYASTGLLTVHTDAGTSVVPADRVAWTPAHHVHHHRAHGDTDMRILFLSPAVAGRLPGQPAVFAATGLEGELIRTLTDAHNYDRSERKYGRYDSAAQARLLRVLVDELRDVQNEALQIPEPHDDRLRTIGRILSEAPENNDSLTELGRIAGASSRTLSRLIHSELGMSFHEWRTHLRICHALVFLTDGEGVTQTAQKCGWSNPSDFIAAFTKIIGVTPGRYRAERRAQYPGLP